MIPVGSGVIAVLADFSGTPYGSTSPFASDITSYVLTGSATPGSSPVTITWGRQSWLGDVTTSTMSLSLMNADGRFTPGRSGLVNNLLSPDQASPGQVTGTAAAFTSTTCTLSVGASGGTFPDDAFLLRVSAPSGLASSSTLASTPCAVTAGVTYAFSMEVSNPTGSGSALFAQVTWLDNTGASLGFQGGSSVSSGSRGYSTGTATAPAGAVTASLRLKNMSTLSIACIPAITALDLNVGTSPSGEVVSPYFPWVRRRTPIRVVDTLGGTAVNLFTGYMDNWTATPQGGSYWTTPVNATDILGRMGSDTPLRGFVVEEIMRDSPGAFFTLQEAEGSASFADLTASSPPATVGNSKFGAGIVDAGQAQTTLVGDSTVVTLTNSAYGVSGAKTGSWLVFPNPANGGAWAFEAWVLTPTTTGNATIFDAFNSSGLGWSLTVSTGFLALTVNNPPGSAAVFDNVNVCDGLVHHVVCEVAADNKTVSLYRDGVLAGTSTSPSAFGNLSVTPTVRAGMSTANGPQFPFTGGFAYVAQYPTALTSTRVATHYQAGLTGFLGERTDTHITRLLSYRANYGSSLDTGLGYVGQDDIAGQTLQDALLETGTAENGVVYANGSGQVTMRSRSRLFNPPVALTLDCAQGHVDIPTTFLTDLQNMVNDVTVSRPGGADQRWFNAASIAQDGEATSSITANVATDAQALDIAGWTVAEGVNDQVYCPSLTVNLYTIASAAVVAGVLGLQPFDVVQIVNLPPQAPASTMYLTVQGGTLTIAADQFTAVLYATPLAPQVWAWDGPGTWDGTAVWAF